VPSRSEVPIRIVIAVNPLDLPKRPQCQPQRAGSRQADHHHDRAYDDIAALSPNDSCHEIDLRAYPHRTLYRGSAGRVAALHQARRVAEMDQACGFAGGGPLPFEPARS
jgi:hypothetical protein